MPHIRFYRWASVLITLPIVLASIPALAQQAGAIVESVTQVDTGRYRLVGTALAANGSPACALAMASGRCMFTCGPGSLRCEGGTASLPLGKFDLTNLPTEANGTIILQIFVQGAISFTQTINPSQPSGTAKWSAYNNTCCSSPTAVYTSTYEVTVDGATKRSVSNSCTSGTATLEGFASTTPGAKNYTARILSSACGNQSASGTVTMAGNACYRFQLDFEGGALVNKFGTVTCPSSADATTLQDAAETTPMAIFPMVPDLSDGVETPAATYQSLQRQP